MAMSDTARTTALIVDDNPHMRSILIALLSAVGVAETRQASDGEEAIAILGKWTPSFIVVDQNMQPMSGAEFARSLRRDPASPNAETPIVMLTAHTERAIVEQARDAGIDEILAKPVAAKTLLQRLHAITHERRPFVRTPAYVGPDRRRRRNDPNHDGPRRRSTDVRDVFTVD
jgi:CheY-like chemotaxis protein